MDCCWGEEGGALGCHFGGFLSFCMQLDGMRREKKLIWRLRGCQVAIDGLYVKRIESIDEPQSK